MRSFAGVGDRFLTEMSRLDGGRFRGAIMPASDQEGASFEFSNPRLVMRTRAEAEVAAGVVIRAPGGPLYIVGEHYGAEPDYRTWRLFLAERQMRWERPNAAAGTDPLTGLERSTPGKVDLGLIWACVEHDRRMFTDPGLKVKVERVTLITHAEIQHGDLLDGEPVNRVTRDLGLFIAETG